MTDSNVLHISGGAEIETALENDTEYSMVVPITTYAVGDSRSNYDGTYTVHHKAKISGVVSLIRGQAIIRGKDTKKESQRTRGAILALQDEEEKLEIDKEVFYSAIQQMIRRNLPEIYEQFKKELPF